MQCIRIDLSAVCIGMSTVSPLAQTSAVVFTLDPPPENVLPVRP